MSNAYEALRERILTGAISPGSRLREVELAASLGLSRTPVREALRRLEADGLVEHLPHRGAVVRVLGRQEATELYLMREVLEGTAAEQSARHMSAPEREALRDVLEAERAVTDDPVESARLNLVFHRALAHGAHNRYLIAMLESLAQGLSLLGRTTLGMLGRADAALEEHETILRAVEAGDAASAGEAARAHIRAAHRARLGILMAED